MGMRGKPILIVEDNDLDFEAINESLRAAGFRNELHRALHGEACLEMLHGTGEKHVEPAIVLLDLNTPGIDGRTVLAEMRADERFKSIPVVVLTSSANPRDIEYCYKTGANAYHVKPLEVPLFDEVVRDLAVYWLEEVVLPGSSEKYP
jgi:CheY-like chemotaxis protein